MKKEQQLIDRINQEQERASLYLIQYTDSLIPVQNIMVAYGILTGMLSDILHHESSKGSTARTKASKKKVLDLMEIVEGFSKISDQNKAAQLNITAQLNRIVELENERDQYKNELEAVKKAWDQTA